MNANENVQEKWNQLSEYLNSLATDGKKKDVKSWKTVSIYTLTFFISCLIFSILFYLVLYSYLLLYLMIDLARLQIQSIGENTEIETKKITNRK